MDASRYKSGSNESFGKSSWNLWRMVSKRKNNAARFMMRMLVYAGLVSSDGSCGTWTCLTYFPYYACMYILVNAQSPVDTSAWKYSQHKLSSTLISGHNCLWLRYGRCFISVLNRVLVTYILIYNSFICVLLIIRGVDHVDGGGRRPHTFCTKWTHPAVHPVLLSPKSM